jgi:hypothetical protein
MTFDQTAERTAVEDRLLDSCLITRDTEGDQDDVLDPVTLNLTRLANDAVTVYSGPCSVAPYTQSRGQNRNEGQREETRQVWRVRLPLSASEPKYGDLVTITAVHENGDQALVDKRLTIIGGHAHTLGVSRVLVCQDEKGETVQ